MKPIPVSYTHLDVYKRQEEILLFETQGLALDVVVLRVENLGDDLRHGLVLRGLEICLLYTSRCV